MSHPKTSALKSFKRRITAQPGKAFCAIGFHPDWWNAALMNKKLSENEPMAFDKPERPGDEATEAAAAPLPGERGMPAPHYRGRLYDESDRLERKLASRRQAPSSATTPVTTLSSLPAAFAVA